jgi:hypothetical protein
MRVKKSADNYLRLINKNLRYSQTNELKIIVNERAENDDLRLINKNVR